MKKRQILTLMLALAICAGSATMLTGCKANVRNLGPVEQSVAADTGSDNGTLGGDTSVEESSEEVSTEESSEDESSADESSEEESSEAESSVEESSEAESSVEESSEAEESGVKTATIKFQKPDNWTDEVTVSVYEEGGQANGKQEMTKESDGTYTCTVKYEETGKKMLVSFQGIEERANGKTRPASFPRSGGLEVVDGQTYSNKDS